MHPQPQLGGVGLQDTSMLGTGRRLSLSGSAMLDSRHGLAACGLSQQSGLPPSASLIVELGVNATDIGQKWEMPQSLMGPLRH